jgi:PAS domain S-box-containing protein
MPTRSILHVRRGPHPAYLRYGVACAAVAATLGLRVLLTPFVPVGTPYISLVLAVVLSSWFGGMGPGIFATALSAAADWYLVLAPHGGNAEQAVAIILYVAQGLLVAYLISALRRSRRRINTIIRSISDAFAVFDSHWRIVYINETAAAIAGIPQDKLVGQNLWKTFPEIVGTLFWEKLHEASRDGRPAHFEYYSDQRKRWVENSVYPSAEGLTLFIRDITDRKRDQSDLEAAKAEIERMNQGLERRVQERTSQLNATIKELEAFSYSVSHDLRAPLRAIDGFSRLLFEDYYSQLDVEGKRLIDVIRNSTVKMGYLIDGLLAFSRLGRQALASSEVDMTDLAHEALHETVAAESGRNVEVRIGQLPPALGDRLLFRQVFINLLSNAMKFTRGKNPAVIEVGSTASGDNNIFFVKDNGVGFDMRYVDKLFGVFQRLHAVNEFEGTGLGLAIVQRIVHRHGGRVWAEGVLGQGATIFFSLPKLKTVSQPIRQETVGAVYDRPHSA